MARKRLNEVGETENKVRWNKKKTRKYEIITKLTEVKPKSKRKRTSTEPAKKKATKTKTGGKKKTSPKTKTKKKS